MDSNVPTRSAIALNKRNIVEAIDSNNRPMLFKNIVTKPFRPRRHSEITTVASLIFEGAGDGGCKF